MYCTYTLKHGQHRRAVTVCCVCVHVYCCAECAGERGGAIAWHPHHCIQYSIDTPGLAAEQRLALRHSRRGSQDPQPRCTDHSRLQAGLTLTSLCFLSLHLILCMPHNCTAIVM